MINFIKGLRTNEMTQLKKQTCNSMPTLLAALSMLSDSWKSMAANSAYTNAIKSTFFS